MKSNLPTTTLFCLLTGLIVYTVTVSITAAGPVTFILTLVSSLAYWGGWQSGNEAPSKAESVDDA